MKLLNTFATALVALSIVAAPAALAQDMSRKAQMQHMPKMAHMDEFMKSCDMDHDGMMSKAEMVKHMEKMFDQMDTGKTGKLDKKQSEAFLKQFTSPSGA
jgi:Ca2+-binding EF-hand superfamily protein